MMPDAQGAAGGGETRSVPVTVAARVVMEARRGRRLAFGDDADLIADPVWDALLALLVADAEARPVAADQLAAMMFVPASNALRWMILMERRALITRTLDDRDGSATLVSLTSHGRALTINALKPLWSDPRAAE